MSSFFGVLVGEYASKLRIPPLFVSRFSSLAPKTATLLYSSKRLWTVDIEEEDNKKLYFKRGWNIFVEDNALETGEFIVFKFDGDSTFKANIYGKSYLKRKSSMSVSSFFKVLINGESTTKLRIPLLFVSGYSTLVPKTVTFMRASSNRSWKVDIVEEDDKRLYYKTGWSEFVDDNALEIAHFLVFKFDGDSTFRVKIYGSSACEKELENQPCINQKYCIQYYNKQTTTLDHQENLKGSDPIDVDRQKSKPNVEITEERVDHDDRHENSNQETEAPQKEAEEQSDETIAVQPESHCPLKKTGNKHDGPMRKASSSKGLSLESKR
ncbi:putative B3 domain-containing protein Os03g0621600, partial [Neltuma alba]|uniref:putative B3 domain-containing protein Os03g0621600 n=1 Tax=Neltuma alba TaxID=207710 RepID=UPI0010A578A1